MTPRERLKVGSAHKEYKAKPFMMLQQPKAFYADVVGQTSQIAQPKPWDDKDSPPYPNGGDPDGDGDNTHKYAPGEEVKIPPAPSPSSDTLNLRSSLEAAAEASRDPDAQQAMRAIEARLAEITQYMRAATRGASRDMAIKLGVLTAIL